MTYVTYISYIVPYIVPAPLLVYFCSGSKSSNHSRNSSGLIPSVTAVTVAARSPQTPPSSTTTDPSTHPWFYRMRHPAPRCHPQSHDLFPSQQQPNPSRPLLTSATIREPTPTTIITTVRPNPCHSFISACRILAAVANAISSDSIDRILVLNPVHPSLSKVTVKPYVSTLKLRPSLPFSNTPCSIQELLRLTPIQITLKLCKVRLSLKQSLNPLRLV
jgi:hypothetical protein